MLDAESVAAAEAAPLLARVAKLDFDQVYWGLGEPIPVDQVVAGDKVFGDPALRKALPEGAVWVERDCDFTADKFGKYKLVGPDDDAQFWRFVPLPQSQQKSAEEAASLEQALYDLAIELGAKSPRVLSWCKAFEQTVEGRKA